MLCKLINFVKQLLKVYYIVREGEWINLNPVTDENCFQDIINYEWMNGIVREWLTIYLTADLRLGNIYILPLLECIAVEY